MFIQKTLMKQKGFTLLEILIAVLILSIGLLGFAALQISAISSSQDGYYRSQALLIAGGLADKMRANRDYVNWDDRADDGPAHVEDDNLYGSPAGNLYDCAAPNPLCADDETNDSPAVCNQQQLAAYDVFTTCNDAADLLPEGVVSVVCTSVDIEAPIFDNKPNPYVGLNHPNYAGTPPVLDGPSGDACSPKSRYSIFVGWKANDFRRDTGELTQSIKARCKDAPPDGPGFDEAARTGFGVGFQCVLLELIP